MSSSHAVRPASLVVVVLASFASVASSRDPTADISGASGPFDQVLTADDPARTIAVDAVLTTTAPIASESGEVGLQVEVSPDAVGSLSLSLRSDTTGESNQSDLLDPQSQGVVRIGIPAFEGCGAGTCTEALTIELVRNDTGADDLALSWSLDGLAAFDTSDPAASGSIAFTVH